MPRQAAVLPPEADLEKLVVLTTRVRGKVYNQLVEEAKKRGSSTLGGEMERLINRCQDLEELFFARDRDRRELTQFVARLVADAIRKREEMPDDPELYERMIADIFRRLWRHHPTRDATAWGRVQHLLNDARERELAASDQGETE
jgi:hypothetical protein